MELIVHFYAPYWLLIYSVAQLGISHSVQTIHKQTKNYPDKCKTGNKFTWKLQTITTANSGQILRILYSENSTQLTTEWKMFFFTCGKIEDNL